jgi:hypothetical protein
MKTTEKNELDEMQEQLDKIKLFLKTASIVTTVISVSIFRLNFLRICLQQSNFARWKLVFAPLPT